MVSGISTVGISVFLWQKGVPNAAPVGNNNPADTDKTVWGMLERVVSVGEIVPTVSALDSSAFGDAVECSIDGRTESVGTLQITFNEAPYGNGGKTKYEHYYDLQTRYNSGCMWLQIANKAMQNAYFVKVRLPKLDAKNATEQNSVSQITVDLAVLEVHGWDKRNVYWDFNPSVVADSGMGDGGPTL